MPFLAQIKLFFLQSQHESTTLVVESTVQEIDHARALIETRRGTFLAAEISVLERRVAELERVLTKRKERLADLERQIGALLATRRAGPMPQKAFALAPIPLLLAMSTASATAATIVALLLVAGVIIGAGWILKRRRGRVRSAIANVRRKLPAEEPASAEVTQLMDRGLGRHAKEIVMNFWHERAFLLHRFQVLIDRDDGLDRTRADLEDADLVYVDDDGRNHAVHVLVATEAEWRMLPPAFQVSVLSRRSRRTLPTDVLRQLTASPATGDAEDDDVVAPPASSADPTPATAKPGRHKSGCGSDFPCPTGIHKDPIASAPGVMPNQPPRTKQGTNGSGKGHSNGGATLAGGDRS